MCDYLCFDLSSDERHPVADAGWYPDPQDQNAEQYWDGQAWTGQRRGAGSTGPGTASPVHSEAQETRINPVFPATPEPAAQPPQQPPQWQGDPTGTQNYAGTANYGGAQGYGTPGYGTPGHSPTPGYSPTQGYPVTPEQGYGAQPGQPQAGYPGSGAAGQQWGGSPAPATKKRRNLLIAAGAVVVLVAAGLVTWLVLPGDDAPSITYQGKAIADADTVLTSAESSVDKTVSARHGVKSKDTRCYFVQAEKPAQGTKKSDVDSSLSCGPVLFVDGDTAQEYLPVRLTADTSSSKARLTPQSSLDGVDPASLRSGYTLVRPDGEKAPDGNGGLKVPAPPPASKNSLTAATLGSTPEPASLSKAVMVGRTRKVTVSAAGYVPRYGTGSDARSAPAGQKLLAFRTAYDDGDVGSGTGSTVKLLVDGVARDVPSPSTDEWVVAAVPDSSSAALQLVDSGDTQSISLPQGQPGAGNIAVLTRTHRSQLLGSTFNVTVQARKGKQKVSAVFRTTATLARLDYWSPANTAAKPSSTRNALLSIRVNYTTAKEKGGPFGYDPPLLRLRLPTGTYVKARNVAPKGKIANVFEVPAGFTTGTLQIIGSEPGSGGTTISVVTPKSIPISIPAG